MKSLEQYFLPEAQIKLLNQLLKDTTDLLDQNEIKYWIDGGSLLGAVRHGGQIPWDDDVDLGVMLEDYQQLPRILLPPLDQGYELIIVDSIFKVIKANSWITDKTRTIGTACLDIFAWISKAESLQLENELDFKRWPNCYHEPQDFYPLTDYDFNGFRVKGPANPQPYLNRMYPGYQHTAVIDLSISSEDNAGNFKNQQVSFPFLINEV